MYLRPWLRGVNWFLWICGEKDAEHRGLGEQFEQAMIYLFGHALRLGTAGGNAFWCRRDTTVWQNHDKLHASGEGVTTFRQPSAE